MKILVLTSRYTATRDIIGEDFGRQTRLFEALRRLGHDIDFFCADYRKFENRNLKLHGINVFIRPFGFCRIFNFIGELNKTIKNKKYELLVATSDPLWGAFGYYYARKCSIRFLYDLHDNYETYLTYRMPFFSLIDGKIIKKADIVTAVSESLKKKISAIRKQNVFVVENGADFGLFKPRDRLQCRKKLKLPLKAKIIAYSGTLQKMQGTDLLIESFERLKKEIDGLYLVLAGRMRKPEEKLELEKNNLIWIKELSQQGVVDLINAADVAVVPSPANEFTKYCFPYKIIEYMACNAKIVATKVGDMQSLLPKSSLCEPGSINALAESIKYALGSNAKADYRKAAEKYAWRSIAKRLDRIIRSN